MSQKESGRKKYEGSNASVPMYWVLGRPPPGARSSPCPCKRASLTLVQKQIMLDNHLPSSIPKRRWVCSYNERIKVMEVIVVSKGAASSSQCCQSMFPSACLIDVELRRYWKPEDVHPFGSKSPTHQSLHAWAVLFVARIAVSAIGVI